LRVNLTAVFHATFLAYHTMFYTPSHCYTQFPHSCHLSVCLSSSVCSQKKAIWLLLLRGVQNNKLILSLCFIEFNFVVSLASVHNLMLLMVRPQDMHLPTNTLWQK